MHVCVCVHTSVPVCNDASTLVFPQRHQGVRLANNGTHGVEHALPDSREIPQVEDVVKLGWGRQHLRLQSDTAVITLTCKFSHYKVIVLSH